MPTKQFVDANGHPVPAFVYRNGQEVAYTGVAGAIGSVIAADCKLIAVWSSTDAYIRVAPGAADATNVDIHAPAGVIIHVPIVAALSLVAAKQITAGGTLHVMECY